MERFGWTMQELDEQDEARLLPSVAAANIYAAVARVRPALDAAAASGDLSRAPRPDDLRAWQMVQKARKHA